MIRHNPFGSGNAYTPSIDQRVPVRPINGQSVLLSVAAARSVVEVVCEWDDGQQVHTIPLRPASDAATSSQGEGHLAVAAAGHRGASVQWTTSSPPVPVCSAVRYRFVATSDRRTRRTRWFDLEAVEWRSTGGIVHCEGVSRLVPGSVAWLADSTGTHRVRFALKLDAHEHVVGFGERYDRLDQRGHVIDATVFEQYKGQGATGRTYLPMPFAHVIGAAGWAFHIDTSRRTWFDVGAQDKGLLWIEADLGGDPLERVCVRFLDGDVGAVLKQWLPVVGAPVELPPWVFRLWASANEWNTQQRVEAEIERHFHEDIPVGVVVIEAWSDESTFTVFRDATYTVHGDGAPHRLADFDFPADGAWTDPKAMVDGLHQRDVRVVLWQIPLAKMRPHPTGQARADAATILARGYGVSERHHRAYRNRGWWFPLALMPDFTKPQARQWWLAKRRYLVDEVGIDGFKTDGGEHGWGEDLTYADGTAGTQGNNLFPVHYAAAYGQLLVQCGKAPVTFSRAGFTGSQAHGAFWAGDEDSTWEAMRSSLRAGLTASACGIVYWGWDIAGFSGPTPDAELYLRATALSTFLPVMQYHSEFNHHRVPSRDRTPWNIAELTGDPTVLTVFRHFAHLRERLVPYLTEQARRTIESGWPLLRSLALACPEDAQAWHHPYQFFIGDDLLVAPIVEPGVHKIAAYLPYGDWVDVWTGTAVRGGRVIEIDVPIDRIAVWCRRDVWNERETMFVTDVSPR